MIQEVCYGENFAENQPIVRVTVHEKQKYFDFCYEYHTFAGENLKINFS